MNNTIYFCNKTNTKGYNAKDDDDDASDWIDDHQTIGVC